MNPNFRPALSSHQNSLFPVSDEDIKSISLVQLLCREGDLPSWLEDAARERVVNDLKQIVSIWATKVDEKARSHSRLWVPVVSATILPFGSYGLGVHTSDSDIDALCVGPSTCTRQDFFMDLHEMLSCNNRVSDIYCIKDAKVPLLRFKFDGISVDLAYAQLAMISIPENVDLQNFMANIDETSRRSISGVLVNKSILQHVPNIQFFRELLCCVKLWAKRRGVYGPLFGYFGGVHLAVLAASICKMHLNVQHLSVAMADFFHTFSNWDWPRPVTLSLVPENVRIPPYMPIHLPYSAEFCHAYMTDTTYQKIKNEFRRGHNLTMDRMRDDFNWEELFQPFPYTYKRYIRLLIYADDESNFRIWLSYVKSRFFILIRKLQEEELWCDPNPSEYSDATFEGPHVVFYWGLQSNMKLHRCSLRDYFMKKLNDGRYKGPLGGVVVAERAPPY